MLPAPFEYHAPRSVDEALDLLDQFGDEGKVLAGGQSLIPLLKLRFASPAPLVEINKIKDLDFTEERDGTLRIGPLFRHKAAERSTLLASRYHVMADAAPMIADPIIRNRGGIGERSCSQWTPISFSVPRRVLGPSRPVTSSAAPSVLPWNQTRS